MRLYSSELVIVYSNSFLFFLYYNLRFSNLKEIADFIKHQLLYAKDKLHWINKFEKLVSVNEFLFEKGRNKTRLMKIYTS